MFLAELTYGALLWTVFRTKILIVNSKSLFSFSPKRCVSNYSFKTFMINMPLTSVICGFSNNWAKIIFIFNSKISSEWLKNIYAKFFHSIWYDAICALVLVPSSHSTMNFMVQLTTMAKMAGSSYDFRQALSNIARQAWSKLNNYNSKELDTIEQRLKPTESKTW